jgi:serine/threonine-protein kinase RsbW
MLGDRSPASVQYEFTRDDLARMRAVVERACGTAGLTESAAGHLVIAVNELVVNAILYAGGTGRLTVSIDDTGVTAAISDEGPGLPTDTPTDRAAPGAIGGRGLWLARTLCDRMTVTSTADGTTIVLFTARDRTGTQAI